MRRSHTVVRMKGKQSSGKNVEMQVELKNAKGEVSRASKEAEAMFSLSVFGGNVIKPILAAGEAKTIVEVGAAHGWNTASLLSDCSENSYM